MKTCTDPLTHALTRFDKHVYFAEGMVLGEDDFTQEFAYLSGHQHLLSRGALGYGTLCGLQVKYESAEVKVTPGLALTPSGELVRVPRVQCASLAAWLKKQPGLSEGEQHLYVTLEYRSCPTDEEPLPSQPCRTAQESLVPSRWEDDFILDFSFTAPDHRLYRLEHEFSGWLRDRVRTRALMGEETPDHLVNQLIGILQQNLNPDLGAGLETHLQTILAPLLDWEGHLSVPEPVLDRVLQVLTTHWVTTLRTAALDQEATPDGLPPRQHALLLAGIIADFQAGNVNSVRIDETARPVLLDLSLLTTYLQKGKDRVLYGEVTGPTHQTRVSKIQTYDVYPDGTIRTDDEPLTFLGLKDNIWQATPFPMLVGDITGTVKSTFVSALQGIPLQSPATQNNQLLVTTYTGNPESEEDPQRLVWVPVNAPAGDVQLDFEHGDSTVVGLQKHPVSSQTPDDNQILKYTGSEWQPVYLGGDVTGDPQNSQLSAIQGVSIFGPAGAPGQFMITTFTEGLETLQWTPVIFPQGDVLMDFLSGQSTVTAIQHVPVRNQGPDNGQVLMFTGEDWAPVSLGGDVIGSPDSTTVRALQGIEIQGTPTSDNQTLVSVNLGGGEGFVWQVRDLPEAGAEPSSGSKDYVSTIPGKPYGLYAAGPIELMPFNPRGLYNINGVEPEGEGRIAVYFGPSKHEAGNYRYVVKATVQSRRGVFVHVQVAEPATSERVVLQLFGWRGEMFPMDFREFESEITLHLEVNFYQVRAE
ncbi:hypothetical protein [Deinococcus roseus]|uniref:Uncharacterized protein n=1 Tax=Deinococcus roseus TaxID=392414 RepID=A0ABQ2CYI2_9DEIO|nr:hypothetical protein [Deinococcus roseus]GGJ33377.1 hypothetical protein GCM10008938_19520 [Deinococcus roseus]